MRFNKGVTLSPPKNHDQRIKEIIDRIISEEIDSKDFIQGPTEEDLTIPRILPCLGSKTQKVAINTDKIDKKNVDFDWLFLRSSAPPQSTLGEYFGKSISVLKVKDNAVSAGGIAAKGFQVYCLPTRFRGTKNSWYRHEGEDALKDYSGNPEGKGKLHEFVQTNKSKFY